jgi:hypothetical protein
MCSVPELARWSAVEWNARLWRQSIERFKAFMIPVTAPLGRSERRVAAACYVQGLLMPGQRTVPSVSIAAAGSVARSACLPTAHWKGRNRSMVQHGSGNVSPAQSPLLLSSAGTSLASALLLTLSFIPGAPPCRRRQRLRLCPGSQPPNGRFPDSSHERPI